MFFGFKLEVGVVCVFPLLGPEMLKKQAFI